MIQLSEEYEKSMTIMESKILDIDKNSSGIKMIINEKLKTDSPQFKSEIYAKFSVIDVIIKNIQSHAAQIQRMAEVLSELYEGDNNAAVQ